MRKTVTIFLSTLLLGVFTNNSVAEESITPLRTFVSVDEFAKLQSELAKKSVEVQLVQQELAKKTAEAQIHDISGTRPLKHRGSANSDALILQSIYRYQGKSEATMMFDGNSMTVKIGDVIAEVWQVTEITATTVIVKNLKNNTMQTLRIQG